MNFKLSATMWLFVAIVITGLIKGGALPISILGLGILGYEAYGLYLVSRKQKELTEDFMARIAALEVKTPDDLSSRVGNLETKVSGLSLSKSRSF